MIGKLHLNDRKATPNGQKSYALFLKKHYICSTKDSNNYRPSPFGTSYFYWFLLAPS